MRRTKIIGTIGPASESISSIKRLVSSGLDVVRLNMSHGDHATHSARIKNIRVADPNLAILVDLQGPKIRTGKLKDGHVLLNKNSIFTITTSSLIGDCNIVSTSYRNLTKDVRKGDRLLLDDGLIELRVEKVTGNNVICKVINGGVLKDFKGLNLPGVKMSAPGLTSKDRKDLLFAIRQKVDYIAISFVRKPSDVTLVKNIIKKNGADIPVIAKIEKPEALTQLDEIIKVSNGIMVARGDLGVEVSPEKVPIIQKHVINRCNYFGKPVITATQMLESMVVNPRPTRAEASDVANAVFDGTDAIMLSEEVAVGKYPFESVKTMSRIAEEVETSIYTKEHHVSDNIMDHSIASAVAHSACHTAEDINAKAIIAFTSSGFTAKLVSKYKTDVPVFAVMTKPSTFRRVKLYFGVIPVLSEKFHDTDGMIVKAEKALLKNHLLKKGDLAVLVAGVPVSRSGTTNLIKVHRIGEVVRLEK